MHTSYTPATSPPASSALLLQRRVHAIRLVPPPHQHTAQRVPKFPHAVTPPSVQPRALAPVSLARLPGAALRKTKVYHVCVYVLEGADVAYSSYGENVV